MVSVQGYLTSWVVWALMYRKKRQTELEIIQNVKDNWQKILDEEVVPASLASAPGITVSEEVFIGSQEWKVFHCAGPDALEADKVVVYWHGGAFINGAAPQHWHAIHRLIKQTNFPVIHPLYKLAPLSTADQWAQAVVEFLIQLGDDPRYAGKQIVHMGDSAGGWMTLRVLQLMCGVVLGEEMEQLTDTNKEKVKSVMKRMGTAIMISPLVDIEINEHLIAKNEFDFWLSLDLWRVCQRLWIRGSSTVKEIDFELPSKYPKAIGGLDPSGAERPYSDPRYSPAHGLGVFERYHAAHPETRPIRLLTAIATHDLCHVGVEAMQEKLQLIPEDVLRSELIEEQGLFHVYPLLSMPETDKVWKRIDAVLRE